MRNLELLYSTQLSALTELSGIQCSSVDYDTGIIYCASAYNITGLNPRDGEISGVISLVNDGYLPPDGSGKVVGIQCIPDQQSVCVATDNGNLLLWNVFTQELECVGNVESGITSMSWSPDMELLVLTTGQETMIMMTRDFDPITEKSLHPENFGSAEFITVGWGKKETQFHGSVGKQAATLKPEDEKPALPWDDRKPRISWRGDGQFFVVSTISPSTGSRKLRVWSREGEHDSTSENVDGVEHALCWKPSGSLITSSLRKPNRHEIIFFEKNGLRHGEFTLPFSVKQVEVKEVLWNTDSTVLAVWCEDLLTDDNTDNCKKSYVQLWTVGNYHWYLKQSLPFESDKPVSVLWDPEHAYKLHIVSSAGKYLQYTWYWATKCSHGKTENDQALVAVIDGDKVLLTPMRNMVVPPPMCAYSLQLPCAVNQVTFCCHGNTNNIAVSLVNGQIAIYTFDESQREDTSIKFDGAGGGSFGICCKTPVLKDIYRIEGLPASTSLSPLSLSHMVWLNNENFVLVYVDQNSGNHSVICNAEVQSEGSLIKISSSSDLEDHVYKMAMSNDSEHIAVQLPNGSLLKYDPVNESVLPWEDNCGQEINFPLPCPQMAVCNIGGQEVVLGLTDRYRLYVNNTEVATNCTSFAIHDEYLLLTTLSHTCRCICRQTKVEVLPTLSDGKEHPFDESIRRVERGSRIVHVVADDTKLVLQMPRGNLETIHPRALVLSAVRKALDRVQFKEAMILMRKHRINLNLIFDHNPKVFLDNVTVFVQQVESVNNISLFITDLQAEDVTVTMYTVAYQRTADGNEFPNKVDTICDAVRQSLIDVDENKYLLSILVTYVRKSTPELEKALLLVRSLREKPDEVVSAEEALKYLLFLVDVNEMYDVALGTYDFDLVLMVAEKSQKDPKEYIPFLNSLRHLQGHYQSFTIDKYLKRYKKALNHISKCGAEFFSECISLVKEHKLFTEALELYSPVSQHYKQIASLYGEYLSEKCKHEEAGIMFVKAESWEQALSCFKACKNWRQIFCMTARLKYSPDKEMDIAKKLTDQLKEARRHQEAAIVLEQYVLDIEESIVCLIEGCLWEEALRMMYKHNRTDFIETNLKSALIETYEHQIDTMKNLHNDFEKYTNRLDVVRKQKEKERLEFLESGGDLGADADLYSDTSSATGESIQSSRYSSDSRQSAYSKTSGRSSKNRRKAEHKKWKLKEGSQYEDLALIAALSRLIRTVDDLRDEVQSLLKALVQFHFDKQASELQQKFSDFLSDIEKSIPDIWNDETNDNSNQPILGPTTTANSIAQAVQRGQVVTEKQDPIIRIPPTLNKDKKWKLSTLESSSS